MANQAEPATPQAPLNHEHGGTGKTPWWQMFFLFPAFGVAFLSAIPTWIAQIESLVETIQSIDRGYDDTKLVKFMKKNPKCVKAPFDWVNLQNDYRIDGTICSKTGDIWLTLQTPDASVYRGIELAELLADKADKKASLFGMAAHASTAPQALPSLPSSPKANDGIKLAQTSATIVCQKFQGSTIIRHVRVGSTCYDEVINSHTGIVQSKTPTACRPGC